jgi:hypothetical protein
MHAHRRHEPNEYSKTKSQPTRTESRKMAVTAIGGGASAAAAMTPPLLQPLTSESFMTCKKPKILTNVSAYIVASP